MGELVTHKTKSSWKLSISVQRLKSCPIAQWGKWILLSDYLVIFVLNLPEGQVLYFGEIQITEGL